MIGGTSSDTRAALPGVVKRWTTEDPIALGEQHVRIGQYAAALQIALVACEDPTQALLSFYHHVKSGDPAVAVDMDALYDTVTPDEKITAHISEDLRKTAQWLMSWKRALESDDHGLDIFVSRHEDKAVMNEIITGELLEYFGLQE